MNSRLRDKHLHADFVTTTVSLVSHKYFEVITLGIAEKLHQVRRIVEPFARAMAATDADDLPNVMGVGEGPASVWRSVLWVLLGHGGHTKPFACESALKVDPVRKVGKYLTLLGNSVHGWGHRRRRS
jgi:hypothetical protein